MEPLHAVSCGARARRRSRRVGLGLFLVLLVATLAALFSAPAFGQVDPAVDADVWKRIAPQERGNALRQGSVDVELTAGNGSTVRWQVHGYKPFLAGPVMDEENAYVVAKDGNVTAIRLATGEKVWSVQLKEAVSASPTIAYGRLYVASEAKRLHVLSLRSGQELTSATLAGIAKVTPLAADGKIYQGNDAGSLEVFDALSLDLVWKFDTATTSFTPAGVVNGTDVNLRKPIRAPPASYDGRVYLAAWNGKVYKLSSTGNVHGNPTVHWTVTMGDVVNAAPAIDHANSALLIAAADGRLSSLRLDTGATRWQYAAGSAFQSGAAVGNDLFTAGTSLGRLLTLDDLGALKWDIITEGDMVSAPTRAKDALVTATANGYVALRDPANGKVLTNARGNPLQWQMPDGISAESAVTEKGILVVDISGTVTLIGPEPKEKADLIALSIEYEGERIEKKQINLTATVSNDGPHSALAVTARLLVDGKAVKTETLDRLNRGETLTWKTALTSGLAVGDHSVRVTFEPVGAADPDPGRATISLAIPIQEDPDKGAFPLDETGGIDYESLYADDEPETDAATNETAESEAGEAGFVDGLLSALGWLMVPAGLVALGGGVALGIRYGERPSHLASGGAGHDETAEGEGEGQDE